MDLTLVYILVAVLAGGFGQVLLKKGMMDVGTLTLSLDQLGSILLRMVTNPFVVLGLAVYAFSTILWLAALSRAQLSFAYPFVSLGYVVMLIASWQLFHEDISLLRLLGCLTIVTGIILVSRS